MRHPYPNLKEKYLDGEVLFKHYFAMGDAKTIQRLRKFAISKGMVSSTGKEPTDMGVWKAMWRWASLKENKDTAWSIYVASLGLNTVSKSVWVKDMIENKIPSAWQHVTDAKREKFLKENGWI